MMGDALGQLVAEGFVGMTPGIGPMRYRNLRPFPDPAESDGVDP